MKMKKFLSLIMGIAFCVCVVPRSAGQVATDVKWFDFPVSLPDVTTPEFGTARDNHLTRIKMGGPLATGSRINNTTGLEIRSVCEAGDMSVSVTSNLWRFVFNPSGVYATQHGQRQYSTVLAVGVNGKIALNMFSYHVFCGVGLLSNQSDLAGLDYSISRIGIRAGLDGILFTPDDIFVQTGLGTTLVDAVLFIGARVGASVENDPDLTSLNAAIGPAGTYIRYVYQFNSGSTVLTHEYTVWLYQQGGIPSWRNTVEYFRGPLGMTFSLVGPAGSAPITLHSSRSVLGPWNLETSSAMEGTSAFFYFTGDPTNDMGFIKLGNTQAIVQTSSALPMRPVIARVSGGDGKGLLVVSSPGSELDQDR